MTRDLGTFADDAMYFKLFATGSLADHLSTTINYVPGRNLHIPLQDLSYAVTVGSDGSFAGYHVLQSAVFVANAALIYLLLRRVHVAASIALPASLAVIVWPTYLEVAFWPSALPMHLMSTTFILVMLLGMLLARSHPDRKSLWVLIAVFYLLATFTYDQTALAATVALALFLADRWAYHRSEASRGRLSIRWLLLTGLAILVSLLYAALVMFVRTSGDHDYGPTLTEGVFARIAGNAAIGWANLSLEQNLFLNQGLWGVQVASVALLLLRALLAFALIFVIYRTLAARRASRVPGQQPLCPTPSIGYVGVALAIAVAAYLPAWMWWVSPRHNYLPALFIPIIFALLLQGARSCMGTRAGRSFLLLSLGTLWLMNFFFLLQVKGAASNWHERELLRLGSYQAINEAVQEAGEGDQACVEFVDFDIADGGTPFYSEISTWALDRYARDPSANTIHCPAGRLWTFDPVASCAVLEDGPLSSINSVLIVFANNEGGSPDWTRPQVVDRCG